MNCNVENSSKAAISVRQVREQYRVPDPSSGSPHAQQRFSKRTPGRSSSRPKLVSSGGIPRLLLLIRLGLLRGYRRERAEQAVELIVRASSEKQCGGWAGLAIVAKS